MVYLPESMVKRLLKLEIKSGVKNMGKTEKNWPGEIIDADIPPLNPIKPSHYKLSGGREAIDIIKEILTPEQFIGFLRGNIFKYDIRYKQKGGVEDLKKSAWYKEKLIEVESGK